MVTSLIIFSIIFWGALIGLSWYSHGIKGSISDLYYFMPAKNDKERVFIFAFFYLLAIIPLVMAGLLVEMGQISEILIYAGGIGFLGAGVVSNTNTKIKKIIHQIFTLTCMTSSMLLVVSSAIYTNTYWLIGLPVAYVSMLYYMVKKQTKNHTTWLEIANFLIVCFTIAYLSYL